MTEQYTLHNRVGFKVTRLARIMEERLEKQLAEHGITRLMWCVLRGVGMEEVGTPSGLAQYMSIARPAISRLLKTMEEKGLLERVNTSDDKRYTEIVLTELGEQKMADCHVLVRELNTHFSSKLGDQQYQQFMETIDQLTEGEDLNLMRL